MQKKIELSVYIGDAEEVLETFEDEYFHLCVTSPPYYDMRGEMKWKSYEDYLDKMDRIIHLIYKKLRYGRCFCLNVPLIYISRGKKWLVGLDLLNISLKYFNLEADIIWLKPFGIATRKASGNFIKHNYPFYLKFDAVHEYIFVLVKGKLKKPKEKGEPITLDKKFFADVWQMPTASADAFYKKKENVGLKKHRAMYPLILPETLIEIYSYRYERVLDPFLGTGTTLLACKNKSRSGVGIELDDTWLEVIKRKVGFNQQTLEGVDFKIVRNETSKSENSN